MATSNKLSKVDFFYDGTMERYIAQVVRAFSGFQYESFPGNVRTLNVVPCLPNQTDALVASLLVNASDTTALTIPCISVTHTDVEFRREDVQCTTHVSYVQVSERRKVNGVYTGDEGRDYLVERLMPRPASMSFDIDVWTSNKSQKYQLLQQMMTIFAPDIQIQNSENALDWGAMTSMTWDGFTFSSRAGPVGSNTAEIDYFTIKATIPIWLNPPAKVQQRRRIEQIVNNVLQGETIESGTKFEQAIVSPGEHCIAVENNELILLNAKSGLYDDEGQIFDFAALIKKYGHLTPGTTTVRLSTTTDIDDTASDIVGTVDYSSGHVNRLVFTPDPSTLPQDTLVAITGVVNPRKSFPGVGLPNQTIGQRYLFQHSITGSTQGWGSLSAEANDIVEFNGSDWVVSYRPSTFGARVTNQRTGRQLQWTVDGWVFTYDKIYLPGFWRIFI